MGLITTLLHDIVVRNGYVPVDEFQALRKKVAQLEMTVNLFHIDIFSHINKTLQPFSKRLATQLGREKDLNTFVALEGKKSRKKGSSKA